MHITIYYKPAVCATVAVPGSGSSSHVALPRVNRKTRRYHGWTCAWHRPPPQRLREVGRQARPDRAGGSKVPAQGPDPSARPPETPILGPYPSPRLTPGTAGLLVSEPAVPTPAVARGLGPFSRAGTGTVATWAWRR